MNTNIRNTVHAKNVSQSPSKEKRLVSSRIPSGFLSRHDRTRGNSRPLLAGRGGGGHGITDATCVESGISYWAAGFWAALQTGFLQPDSIMLIAYMHVSIWLIRWRVGSPFTSPFVLPMCARTCARDKPVPFPTEQRCARETLIAATL